MMSDVREALERLEGLLQERWAIHRDPEDPDYNECDDGECAWCQYTRESWAVISAALASQQPEAPEDGGVLGYVLVKTHTFPKFVSRRVINEHVHSNPEHLLAFKRRLEEIHEGLPMYVFSIEPVGRAVQQERPKIVCLCGSTRFWRRYQQVGLERTLAGEIVLSIGAASGTDDEHFGNLDREKYDSVKAALDELHLRKIDLADYVLVLCPGGYIGESTRREIAYAESINKPVEYDQRVVQQEMGEER